MKNGREEAPRIWAQLAECKRSDTQSFHQAWLGIEPTFSNKKAVEKWAQLAAREGGEDEYFESSFMLRMVHDVAESIRKRYRTRAKQGDPACLFADCKLEFDRDPWDVERANLSFRDSKKGDDFEVRFGMDPETFEFSIKPVPLVWFNDDNFVRFLQLFVWDVPHKFGLATSVAHGGGQFSISAKTYLVGSLLADDIATKLNHPELSTWIFDYPNADDRAFRATTQRFRAFEKILEQYWAGAFHPRATGVLTVANAFLDRGFGPAPNPPSGLMDARGPVGDAREIFQNNFAFGRKVRWRAQNVDPGYWQSSHPAEDGYRPDQIMRYSEGNLNRLQIAGEWHVKSGKLLDAKDIREFHAPLEVSMLYDEASWEHRGQMSRTSAEDMVEAILLETNHAQYLLDHPGVKVKSSLYQDQILGDAVQTLAKRAPEVLEKLKQDAREENVAASRGRIRSDWIEPETLFWASWRSLSAGERSEIAREAVGSFLEFVEKAATKDQRSGHDGDPMEPHRHRVQPLLWEALQAGGGEVPKNIARELRLWQDGREKYLKRRPPWSVTGAKGPWE